MDNYVHTDRDGNSLRNGDMDVDAYDHSNEHHHLHADSNGYLDMDCYRHTDDHEYPNRDTDVVSAMAIR
jgi:hypothetical protein